MTNELTRIGTFLPAPVGDIETYIQYANRIPMLSQAEETALAQRWYLEQDLTAAKALILPHLRFVIKIARTYNGYGLLLSDLIQEGTVGLMKAVKRFNPNMGVRLVTFAVHWIKAEIHEFILRNWRIVKVATTKAQRKLFFNLRQAKKRLGWFSQEEIAEVANDLGVSPQVVQEMEARMAQQDMALDQPHDDSEQAPVQFLEDSRYEPAQFLENHDCESQGKQDLRSALAELDERSRMILQRRWLAEKKATLHELAAELNVSAERVRQLENNAIAKLRSTMVGDHVR